jgi:hypothetical protein
MQNTVISILKADFLFKFKKNMSKDKIEWGFGEIKTYFQADLCMFVVAKNGDLFKMSV